MPGSEGLDNGQGAIARTLERRLGGRCPSRQWVPAPWFAMQPARGGEGGLRAKLAAPVRRSHALVAAPMTPSTAELRRGLRAPRCLVSVVLQKAGPNPRGRWLQQK